MKVNVTKNRNQNVKFIWSLACIRTAILFPIAITFLRLVDRYYFKRHPSVIYQTKKIEAYPLSSQTSRPSKRSIVFFNNCYYNFFYLAAALRKRGWDAISVSRESPDSPNYQFYHGEDLNLYHPDPIILSKNLHSFYELVKQRYKMLHFYGAGNISIFPQYCSKILNLIPWDFLELKKHGVKIGFSHSGCNDLTSQTSFSKWSGGKCNQCIWKDQADICSDQLNISWGKIIHTICDLICVESDPPLDYKNGKKVFFDPLTFALDSNFWKPDLIVPEKYLIQNIPDEVVIYHAVGNYKLRTQSGKNFKGTHAVAEAVERLKRNGHKVVLHFVSDVPSKEIRYIQAQADIVVDQLNYGRYGANAREALMLGKPTICYLNKQPVNGEISPCISDSPIISATEETIYDVLLDLVTSPEKRKRIGDLSRQHALKWWSSDACAERFEKVYDMLFLGLSPKYINALLRKSYE